MGGRTKTAEATTIDERVYTPSSIEETRENLPGKGRRIRIAYNRWERKYTCLGMADMIGVDKHNPRVEIEIEEV